MLTGKVTSSAGETLPGANVYISDASGNILGNIGTTTDTNGFYSLLPANPGQFVTASYVGYTRKTIQVASQIFNFSLLPQADLAETEIIGKKVNGKAALILIFAVFGLALVLTKGEQ